MKTRLFYFSLATLIFLASFTPIKSYAADYYWIGGSGNWNDPSNWDPYGVPGGAWFNYDSAFIIFSDSIDRTINGVDSTTYIQIGNSGTGKVVWNISEGSNFAGSGTGLHIGSGTILNITGGEFSWDMSGRCTIEEGAVVNQTGGWFVGSGTFNIYGLFNLDGYGIAGDAITTHILSFGVFNQSGGTLTGNQLVIGNTYNWFAGEIVVRALIITSGQLNLLGNEIREFYGYLSIWEMGGLNTSGVFYTYDGVHGLEVVNGTITNINGTHGTIIYYDDTNSYNEYLGGLTYKLTGGGILTTLPELINIDIKAGDVSNIINLKGMKSFKVAILSSADFYAPSQIDQASLTFGFVGNEASLTSCDKKSRDINEDGVEDLVCSFLTEEANFQCGDVEGILRGMTIDGMPMEGRDSVTIAPCH